MAKAYSVSPESVKDWQWQEVIRAQVLVRAEAGAQETVQKHNEARRGNH